MKGKTRGTGIGGTSLILIFAVLCLTIFALLTLSTARANQTLAEKSADFSKEYYQADSRAVQILAGIRKGAETDEIPQEIDGVAITETMDGGSRRISYACPLNDMQAISVELEQKGTEYTVISWKLVQTAQWEADGSFSVWDGE